MSDVECEYCGEAFKEQGLPAHQRYCDAVEEEGSQGGPEYSDLEEAVLERDDNACVRCDADGDLIVHKIDPSGEDENRNLVSVCGDCDGEIDGLHPRTKRTKIQSE
ncbi:hypothetical protein [Natrialba asiatica]|uniref:hypothetical protein n=1 Tax=Natrialba asiatica TaxID=64602 RepID=UPI001268D353|nr:hypothetical protein [Natrialba asiatica]